jgi:hypothetical protein
MAWFQQRGEEVQLTEAIGLDRDALLLLPVVYPDRSISCSNPAGSLMPCFELTGENSLRDESIDLVGETLSLAPPGNTDLFILCLNLAGALMTRLSR